MRCLYCQETIPILKRLTSGRYCCEEHRRKYIAVHTRVALEELAKRDRSRGRGAPIAGFVPVLPAKRCVSSTSSTGAEGRGAATAGAALPEPGFQEHGQSIAAPHAKAGGATGSSGLGQAQCQQCGLPASGWLIRHPITVSADGRGLELLALPLLLREASVIPPTAHLFLPTRSSGTAPLEVSGAVVVRTSPRDDPRRPGCRPSPAAATARIQLLSRKSTLYPAGEVWQTFQARLRLVECVSILGDQYQFGALPAGDLRPVLSCSISLPRDTAAPVGLRAAPALEIPKTKYDTDCTARAGPLAPPTQLTEPRIEIPAPHPLVKTNYPAGFSFIVVRQGLGNGDARPYWRPAYLAKKCVVVSPAARRAVNVTCWTGFAGRFVWQRTTAGVDSSALSVPGREGVCPVAMPLQIQTRAGSGTHGQQPATMGAGLSGKPAGYRETQVQLPVGDASGFLARLSTAANSAPACRISRWGPALLEGRTPAGSSRARPRPAFAPAPSLTFSSQVRMPAVVPAPGHPYLPPPAHATAPQGASECLAGSKWCATPINLPGASAALSSIAGYRPVSSTFVRVTMPLRVRRPARVPARGGMSLATPLFAGSRQSAADHPERPAGPPVMFETQSKAVLGSARRAEFPGGMRMTDRLPLEDRAGWFHSGNCVSPACGASLFQARQPEKPQASGAPAAAARIATGKHLARGLWRPAREFPFRSTELAPATPTHHQKTEIPDGNTVRAHFAGCGFGRPGPLRLDCATGPGSHLSPDGDLTRRNAAGWLIKVQMCALGASESPQDPELVISSRALIGSPGPPGDPNHGSFDLAVHQHAAAKIGPPEALLGLPPRNSPNMTDGSRLPGDGEPAWIFSTTEDVV